MPGGYIEYMTNNDANRETTMNQMQRVVLDVMADENIGAVRVPLFGWVFPEQIRRNADAAYAVLVEWFRNGR